MTGLISCWRNVSNMIPYSMIKNKLQVVRNARALAKSFGLKEFQAVEWEVQASLLKKLREIVSGSEITHKTLGELAGTSRTRITSILNGNLEHVSTDLLIRILSSLGFRVKISVSKSKVAA